jgi:hypothetical protein
MDHFVGAFFLDKASRLCEQKARIAPIVIRSRFSASGFGLTGESKRNLINVQK